MKTTTFLLLTTFLMSSCIGDDVIFDTVDPEIRITNPIDSLKLGSTYLFRFTYFNKVGKQEDVQANWSSTAPTVISIDHTGLAEALDTGSARISVLYEEDGISVTDSRDVVVSDTTVVSNEEKSGSLESTSSYVLKGDFTLEEDGTGGIILIFADNYEASTALPGLFVYMTNNPSSSAGAYEIGAVQIFAGAHSYNIPDASLNDYSHVLYYCKPFNVKVGHGQIN